MDKNRFIALSIFTPLAIYFAYLALIAIVYQAKLAWLVSAAAIVYLIILGTLVFHPPGQAFYNLRVRISGLRREIVPGGWPNWYLWLTFWIGAVLFIASSFETLAIVKGEYYWLLGNDSTANLLRNERSAREKSSQGLDQVGVCRLKSDPRQQDFCLNMLALTEKNPEYCQAIKDRLTRDTCLGVLEKMQK